MATKAHELRSSSIALGRVDVAEHLVRMLADIDGKELDLLEIEIEI